jgi:MFS family permease
VSHGIAAAANGFVSVSLAGSLFFSLSADASRQQARLYLLITLIPLAILSPFVGPTVDRFARRPQPVSAGTYLLRGVFALLLAQRLFELSFYFFAIGLLIASKASGVIKQALVPMVTPEREQLVSANATLARASSIFGAVGVAAAGAVLAGPGAPWVLRCSALLFALSAVVIWRLDPTESLEALPTELEYVETHRPRIVAGSIGFIAIRLAVGFFAFTMAFTLRQRSEALWVYGAVLGIYGLGAIAGNVLTPLIRRRFAEDTMLTGVILAPAGLTAIASLGVSWPMLTAIGAFIGFSTSAGRHAFDSMLQRWAPDVVRGRAVAKYETYFSLAYIAGAVVATLLRVPLEVSMAVLCVIYVPAAVVLLRNGRFLSRFRSHSHGPPVEETAARLAVAEAHMANGKLRAAVLDASSAVDFAQLAMPAIGERPERAELDVMRHLALDAALEVDVEAAERAIELARDLITAELREAAGAPNPPETSGVPSGEPDPAPPR